MSTSVLSKFIIGIGVSCTSYSHRPESHRPMQVFINISSKGLFYSENYAHQSSQVNQNFVEFLSCRVRSSLPGTGSDSHNLIHSAEVRYFSHKRTYPCCQPSSMLVHTSFGVRPGVRSKPTPPSPRLQTHPFVHPHTPSRLLPIIRLYSRCTLDNPS